MEIAKSDTAAHNRSMKAMVPKRIIFSAPSLDAEPKAPIEYGGSVESVEPSDPPCGPCSSRAYSPMSKKSSSSNSSFSAGTANAPVAGLHAAFSQYLTIATQTSSPVHRVCAVEAFLANLLRNPIFKLPTNAQKMLSGTPPGPGVGLGPGANVVPGFGLGVGAAVGIGVGFGPGAGVGSGVGNGPGLTGFVLSCKVFPCVPLAVLPQSLPL
mmetsp:Transcript_98066/g.154555  ORF Transcript_98066/g.154555 Transcript_98066/m.154555 type:complete len:211 (-) Transcript_98066:974-1606(-)